MQSLLRWSIENSGGDGTVDRPQQPLDPGVIDVILGRPDSVLMKEALEIAVDEKRSVEERTDALEEFETLIQSIDNANNLSPLKMWDPIFTLLTSSTSPATIKHRTLWIIGTATQNNPAAQTAYLNLTDSNRSLDAILSFLDPSQQEPSTRAKAIYALTSLLRHHASAVTALKYSKGWAWAANAVGHDNGWAVLEAALRDPDVIIRRKTVYLLNALLTPQGVTPSADPGIIHPNSHASMASNPRSTDTCSATKQAMEADDRRLIRVLFGMLGSGVSDRDLAEKLLRLLHTYAVLCQGQITAEERQRLGNFLDENDYDELTAGERSELRGD